MSSTTWPAPPAESPWGAGMVRTVRPSTSRSEPRRFPDVTVREPKNDPPAKKPKARKKAKPRRRLPAEVKGIALIFGQWMSGAELKGFPDGTRIAVLPGALDRSIDRIRAGRSVCRINWGHGGEDFTRTVAGHIALYVEGDKLMVRITGTDRDGRAVIAAIRACEERELSVGINFEKYIDVSDPGDPAIILTRGKLFEISVVRRGACKGCRLFF